MDCAAVVSLCARDDLQRQAKLTFAMGTHTLADIAVVFSLQKESSLAEGQQERLSHSDFERLVRIISSRQNLDASLCSPETLGNLRRLYEPQAVALSNYLLMALPPWIPDDARRDNWRVGVTDRDQVPFAVSDPFAKAREAAKK
jgi:hypothetical protein